MSLPKLDFRLLSSTTSESSIGSLQELKKPLSQSKGWHSEKYCKYPQNIYISFATPINLRQINLLSHEKKISQKISFNAYCPQGDITVKNYETIPYLNFGYIKLKDNSDNNFKAREFKKIFVDVKCLYLRIDFEKNYANGYNPFNQVSLINIEFFGYKLPGYKNSLINIEITDENVEKLEDFSPIKNTQRNASKKLFSDFLEDICGEKLKELNSKLIENTKNQNSTECFRIKECINDVNSIGKKIFELQIQKDDSVKNENFDKAMELKQSIDILYNQLNRIDPDKKGNNRNNKKHNSAKKSSSNYNSGNNSFLDPDDNILEEIKEENENEPEYNHNNNGKKRLSNNSNNLSNINMINELNTNNNNYNNTNYSSLFNNTKSIDLSKGKIVEDRKNSFELNENEENDFVDYDEVVIPALKNKTQINNSTEEIEKENEEMYKIKLGPLEELKKEDMENYEILIQFIDEDGLRKILSGQYKYKIMGYNSLMRKLDNIFQDKNKEKLFYTLIKLIAQLIEDKKTPVNLDLLDIILEIFKNYEKNKNEINLTRENIYFINDRIISKIIFKLNETTEKIRKKSYDIIIFVLYHNIVYFDLLMNSLLSKDIKNIHSSNNFSIMSKLDMIENILQNYNKIINTNISSPENFPKGLIADYIILNISSSKKEIKEKSRSLTDLAIEKFGLNIFKQKLMDFKLKDLEKLKIPNLDSLLDPLKQFIQTLNLSSDYTMREIISKMKLNESGKKKSRSKSKSKNKSRSKSKEKEEKNDNFNKCTLCKKNLGNENIMEHMKNCEMCYQCKKCKVLVEIKNLTQHRLTECEKKDKFQQCQRCKEAIPIEFYDEHVKNNKCNEFKKNCNRCPLCHEDIPLSKDGFYVHLIKEKCPFKLKYKNVKKKLK